MKRLLAWSIISFFCCSTFAQQNSRQQLFNLDENLALEGYDPVSYFNGHPLEGTREFAYNFKGVIYYFADNKNRAVFLKTPERFEPAYGGWCAYAMGESGEKVKVDPETFKIVEGKLYLFYNFWGNNTLKSWNKREKDLKTNADKNWIKIFR
jgi:YHS domain-containing protein